MHQAPWIHWYFMVFFAGFGAWLIRSRRRVGRIGGLFCRIETPDRRRLADVVDVRDRLENFPAGLVVAIGAVSLAFAPLSVFERVSVTLLYALMTAVMAATFLVGFERFRRARGRRVASLRARDPRAVVPWYVFALPEASALCPLLFLHADRVPALIVMVAALLIVSVAWMVAHLPALVLGDDVVVERFVDDRIRAFRTANLLGVAGAPAFVFISFTGYTDSPLHVAALALSLAGWTVPLWYQLRLVRRPPSAEELRGWA